MQTRLSRPQPSRITSAPPASPCAPPRADEVETLLRVPGHRLFELLEGKRERDRRAARFSRPYRSINSATNFALFGAYSSRR